MSTQQIDKGGLIGAVGGIVTEMVRSHVIKEVYDVPGAIEKIAEALVKAANKLDPEPARAPDQQF